MKKFTLVLLVANLLVAAFFLAREIFPTAQLVGHAPLGLERIALAPRDAVSKPEGKEDGAALCVAWRGFDARTLLQAREQLLTLVRERPLSFTEIPAQTRSWVVFPPLPSARAASLKMQEFGALGIKDYLIVKDGVWRNGISLGLYANPDSANKRIAELEALGVLGVRVEPLARKGSEFYFVIKSLDADLEVTLAALLSAYPGTKQAVVDCP